jgi:hypothetical protein
MKINIKNKNKSKSGFVQLVAIAAVGGIIAGVTILWIESEYFKPTSENCEAKWTASCNAINGIKNMDPARQNNLLAFADGVFKCCLQQKGIGYTWDGIVSKCLKDNSNS